MSAGERSQHGLLAGDVTTVSDHLPHVADFRINYTDIGPGPGENTGDGDGDGSGDPRDGGRHDGAVRLASLGAPGGDRVQFIVELDVEARLAIDIYDVRGAHVRTVRRPGDGVHAAGPQRFEWDGRTRDGRRAASGTYLVRVTASAVTIDSKTAARPLGVTSGKLLLVRP